MNNQDLPEAMVRNRRTVTILPLRKNCQRSQYTLFDETLAARCAFYLSIPSGSSLCL